MVTVTLRNLGGSIVMAIPKRLLELMHLHAGSQVSLIVRDKKLIMESKDSKPQYTLTELVAQCDLSHPMTKSDKEWLEAPSSGAEDI